MSVREDLRKLLSQAVQGPMTDALLDALAIGDDLNRSNIRAVHDQLYLVTAQRQYLDRLAANIGFTRPQNVGISDEAYRRIVIAATAKKQITEVLLEILNIFYSDDTTRAYTLSTVEEPYALSDGDQLYIRLNEVETIYITFKSEDFTNIAQATAKEVADAISKQLRSLRTMDEKARAFALEFIDQNTDKRYVQVFSGALGPSSAIRILGGAAQNQLRFPLWITTVEGSLGQLDIAQDGSIIVPIASALNFIGVAVLDLGGGQVDIVIYKRTNVAANHITAGETVVCVTDTSAPRTITLADADKINGRVIEIKDVSGNAMANFITVQPQTGTIDGQASLQIMVDYGVLRVYSNGTNWFSI